MPGQRLLTTGMKKNINWRTTGCGLEVLSGGDEVTFGSHPALLSENPLGGGRRRTGVSSENQVQQDDILIGGSSFDQKAKAAR